MWKNNDTPLWVWRDKCIKLKSWLISRSFRWNSNAENCLPTATFFCSLMYLHVPSCCQHEKLCFVMIFMCVWLFRKNQFSYPLHLRLFELLYFWEYQIETALYPIMSRMWHLYSFWYTAGVHFSLCPEREEKSKYRLQMRNHKLGKFTQLIMLVHKLTSKEVIEKKDQNSLDQSHAQICKRTHPSHLSVCGSIAEVGELLADRGIHRSKSCPPSRSAVPRNTSRYGPEPALHLQLIN